MRSALLKKLAVLGVSLGLAFLVAEVVARRKFGSPMPERLPILTIRANPMRGWEMVPGVHYTYHHPVHVNRLGLRNAEIEAKAEGEKRLLVLGDSLVYGQGVGDDETLPAYLQLELGKSWNVINAGHRAYDTRQELALLEELGPGLDLDAVLLCWFWNDVLERNIQSTHERLSAKGEVTFDTGDRVEGWSKARWYGKELVRRSALIMSLYDILGASQDTEPLPEEHVGPAIEKLGGYLDRFVELSRDQGFELRFCVLPDARTVAGEHYSSEIAMRALLEVSRRGIPAFDLGPSLRALLETSGRVPVLPYDGHYDAEGNRAMAQALGAWMAADTGD